MVRQAGPMEATQEIAVATVADLRPGQLKEVAVGDRKVLLARLPSGRITATSHLCPHNKAPLANGVLSPDGRLMCPWHGACFNVHTGDIEDAPSPDALVSYPVRIDSDVVRVTVNDTDLKLARRVPTMCKRNADDPRTAVIVGGGAAGWGAAESLRRHGFGGRIVVVCKEPHLPVDRTKLSKGLNVTLDKALLRPATLFGDRDIEFILGTEATGLDGANKLVHLSQGGPLVYDRLLIATGGNPRNFWKEQTAAMANVLCMRSLADAEALTKALAAKKQANNKPNVVIVGASFIGMEAAAVLAKLGTVTVVGMEKIPFERVLGVQVGTALQQLHMKNGVKFRMNAIVSTFEADAAGQCSVVVLQDGTRLPADVVVLGVGVSPATDWLRGAIPFEKDGSVRVNENLQVIGHDGIFAAGDLATYPYHLNAGLASHHQHIRVEHWAAAIQQGAVAAQNMFRLPSDQVPFRTVPFFWTTQFGKSVRYCGHASAFDEDNIIIEGDLQALSFAAYYTHGNQVVAVASVSRDPVVSKSSELMRLGAMPTAEQVRAGKSPLQIDLCQSMAAL